MTLTPLLYAPFEIQIHIAAAIPALLIGPFVLFRRRRDKLHRRLGYAWITSMLVVAISGLFIPSGMALIGHFGPIHFFSVFTIWGVTEGLYHIRRGNIRKHQASMRGLWYGAMGLAGLFTVLPGRRLNQALFGASENLGWLVIALGLLALAISWRRHIVFA